MGETPAGQTIWRCRICGYEYVGEELPDDYICPVCKHPASDFEKIEKKEKTIIQMTAMRIKKLLSGLMAAAMAVAFYTAPVQAKDGSSAHIDYLAEYEPIYYDSYDGLVSAQINTVAQTDDGYIWVGTYSGLYRYDGYRFEKSDIDERICNVMRLCVDSDGWLWIGTNDTGLACYEPVTGETHFYTKSDGLAADSIRSLCEGSDGKMYVGTVGAISTVDHTGRIETLDMGNDIYGIKSLTNVPDGRMVGATNSGILFLMQGGRLLDTATPGEEGVYYNAVSRYTKTGQSADDSSAKSRQSSGDFLVGTSSDYIDIYKVKDDRLKQAGSIACPDTSYFNDILYDTEAGGYFYSAESGLGFIDESSHRVQDLSQPDFVASVSETLRDYEGNIWFVSNKQGIIEYSRDPFTDIFVKVGIEDVVVNAVAFHGDEIYIGTDSGLYIVDKNKYRQKKYSYTAMFDEVRVRHILEDSGGNMWVSTYGRDGLIEIKKDGSIAAFNESEGGTLGGRFRCTIELSDGTILAASNMGLNYIRDGKVISTLGESEGITAQILTLVETGDGSVLAGSDGDGIYRISDGRITEHLNSARGLETLVVLRIIPGPDGGYIYVTSNALYYDDGSDIKKLKSFPYTNNYDIHFTKDGEAWVYSSAGIYVLKTSDLISDTGDYAYTILDVSRGFTTTPTANAWNESEQGEDEHDEILYISCTDGVRKVSTAHYDLEETNYNILINYITYEDEKITPDENGRYTLPAGDGRIVILPAILNFNLSNPLVKMYLEGAGDEGFSAYHENISTLNYTNLPYGDYTLHVQILDPIERSILRDETFSIYKEPRMTELLWVRILLILLAMAAAGFIVYRVIKTTTIARQVEEIRAAKEEADRANSAKSRFLANMSHEIRTPINTIMGMDEMILREDKSGAGERYSKNVTGYARSIKRASDSLLSLVNDILDLSKIESGKMNLVEREYDTVDMLRGVCNMIRVRSADKGLDFFIDIDKSLPAALYADDGKIKQVTLNLLTNAVKYTERGSFIMKVEVTDRDDEYCTVRYEVSDTGIGIRPEDMDKLFSAFDRLDEQRNSGIQGTGLGLDISKKFTILMGDDLHVESVYGEGSTFYFCVKQRIVDATPIGEFVEEEEEPEDETYVPLFVASEGRVLIVDDSDMNLTVIRGLLTGTRVQVDTALSGRECLDKLEKGDYHIVFLDHMMPEMDGIETMHRIREAGYDVPVYALTANAAESGDDYYIGEGFIGYLPKPVDGRLLEEAIAKYLPKELMLSPDDQAAAVPGETQDLAAGESAGSDGAPADTLERLRIVSDMNVDDGIKACGTPAGFINAVQMFYDGMEEKSQEIEDAFGRGDYELLTIKVHALKTAARLTGFNDLSGMAEHLEDAGKAGDNEYIVEHTGELLARYRGYGDALSFLEGEGADDDREPIDADMLADAYESIAEMAEMMDYDSVEMIIDEVKGYRLPPEDRTRFKDMEKRLKVLDWDGLSALIGGEK